MRAKGAEDVKAAEAGELTDTSATFAASSSFACFARNSGRRAGPDQPVFAPALT